MVAKLPKFIDPIGLADKNAKIEGKLPLADFKRISELLFDNNGDILFQLNFFKERNLAKVDGHISGALKLKCQRCLESISWDINSNIKLGIVNSLDQVHKLPDDVEPLLVDHEEKIDLKDIVEDELLLSMPTIPKHQSDCTAVNLVQQNISVATEKSNLTKKNPFSILADFKNLENYNGSTKK